jgi:hypothetical protein
MEQNDVISPAMTVKDEKRSLLKQPTEELLANSRLSTNLSVRAQWLRSMRSVVPLEECSESTNIFLGLDCPILSIPLTTILDFFTPSLERLGSPKLNQLYTAAFPMAMPTKYKSTRSTAAFCAGAMARNCLWSSTPRASGREQYHTN